MFPSFWRQLLRRGSIRSSQGKSSQGKRLAPSRRVELSLECLETRVLLSADVTPFYLVYNPHNGVAPMGSPGPGGLSPSQIEQAYGFNQLSFTSNGNTLPANGSGQTIAIVDAYNDPSIANDLQKFDSAFGLPTATLTVLNQNGGASLPGVDPSNGWELEESLDVEWSHAIAPGANIVLIEANSNNWSDLETAVQTAAALPGVAAVSMSWGGGEFSGENTDDSLFTTPTGHTGVVFVASSGDSGSPVSYPAVSPNVLSVGGTTLSLSSSGSYQSESAWSGSGGGISAYEPLPSYQPSTYSNGATTGTSTMRMNPDVAYDANPGTGFSVYDSYNEGTTNPWITVGGTSDAAPQWAALVAITDEGRELKSESALDGPSQLLPMLYKMPTDFHDITSGTTTGTPNYTAGPGYDLTTGLGTPIANYLVPDLIYGAAPGTPTGLTATAASSSQINLSWNSATDAHSYTIERSMDNANWQVLATTSGTTYSDTGLQASTAYYYRLLATNGLGSSAYSASVNATTQGGGTSGGTTASFVKTDTTTEGNWKGVYGSQGYNVIDNASSYPSYAQVSASGNSNYVWSSNTTDPRALQDASGSGRIAATWFSSTSFTVNVNLTDGQTHQLALYVLDWANNGRSEQVQILNATTGQVLSSETVSNFSKGEYLVWNVSGDVEIHITNLDGKSNAVLSGLFFDATGSSSPPPSPSPSGTASFVKTDTTTEGSWQGVYGSQGYNVIDDASSYPSYAQVSATGNSNYVWTSSTSDPRALQEVGSSNRIAATWFSNSSFTVNVNLTDGQTHQLALYLLDWDNNGRSEQVQILDATTGQVLSTESASNFQNGEYLVWNVSGDIDIRITNLKSGSTNAVLSGIFLG